jgi:hypothetical protein
MWYDFMESGSSGICWERQIYGGIPCKNWWNSQYLMDKALYAPQSCYCCTLGLAYMTDDAKKAGFRLNTPNQCCYFVIDSVCYPIIYSRQTRGSGGLLNTQNSIHVAYFDLVPYRCTVSGGGGFYANGNACPAASGLICCLMYIKQDTFLNN